ncbi:hypothetical protein Cgig2_018123 [Carnegiea gigantea]|uniref:VQ domain-containing protein n=1 Tax=Carnegiea gigantea TaxID=171969 RepID=A0A9Q1JLV3_9CARY|nr:hypothetical protein Cgig2_018123 [Carnegiea gigantea]
MLVCSACSLRGSCDRAYVTLKESEQDARTVDLVRLLLFYALDPLAISGALGSQQVDHVNSSARKLLRMLTHLSEASPALAPLQPSFKDSYQMKQIVPSKNTVMAQSIETKKGSKNTAMAQNVEMKKGNWVCPECRISQEMYDAGSAMQRIVKGVTSLTSEETLAASYVVLSESERHYHSTRNNSGEGLSNWVLPLRVFVLSAGAIFMRSSIWRVVKEGLYWRCSEPSGQHHHHNHALPPLPPMKQNGSNNNTNEDDNGYKDMNSTPWPLKIHKDSHTIKKSSSMTSIPGSMSSVGTTMAPKPSQQRPPLIIYTHSPKTIHTNPKDFMSLVQKLTGMSPSEQPTDHNVTSDYKKVRTSESHMRTKDCNPSENDKYEAVVKIETLSNNSNNSSDDNDSSSVITEENCCNSNVGDVVNGRLNSYVETQFFDPTSTSPSSQLLPNLPFCNLPNSTSDLLSCSGDLLLYDYMDFNFPLQ